jgi:hypothetical protein
VDQHPRSAELGQAPGLRDERVGLAGRPRAVHEPCVELAVGGGDRLARLTEVGDVVQRVVEAENVDPALGRRGDEALDEVGPDRSRPGEEAAAERHCERGLRARAERADALPRALDAALHRRVEAPAARDLEVREPGGVQDLGETKLLCRRHHAGERLLAQEPNCGVHQRRHLAQEPIAGS